MKSLSLVLALLTAFFLGSCAFDPNTLSSDKDLQAAIDDSDALKETDIKDATSTTVSGAPSPTYTGWARSSWEIASTTKDVVSSDPGSGLATIKITRNITGSLKIATNWTNFTTGTLLGTKSFSMTKTRYATFEKSRGKWSLTQASYAVASSASPTLNITKVVIYASSNSTTPIQTITADTMTNLNKLSTMLTLPNFTTLRAEVTVSANSGVTPLVYLHHAERRTIMYDDGTTGDTTSGDKVYSTYFYVGGATFKHIHFDAIDQATINNPSDTSYNSVVWNVIFKKE